MGPAFYVEFLTTCSLKDFSTNMHACHLKKWEKKKLIGNLKLKFNKLAFPLIPDETLKKLGVIY